jgi:pilus assembly protein CpaF
MFGKRSGSEPVFRTPAAEAEPRAPQRDNPAPPVAAAAAVAAAPPPPRVEKAAPVQAAPVASKPVQRAAADTRSEDYYQIKSTIFNALIDTIDLAQLAQLDPDSAREEIRDIVNEIISIKAVVMSVAEQEHLLQDICNDVLGYGPLEPLLARDDIADIMVNGANRVFIEVSGKVQLTNIRFRDNAQLMNICQRIVSQVGRRVDESSPICDARLLDGSRCHWMARPSPFVSSRKIS